MKYVWPTFFSYIFFPPPLKLALLNVVRVFIIHFLCVEISLSLETRKESPLTSKLCVFLCLSWVTIVFLLQHETTNPFWTKQAVFCQKSSVLAGRVFRTWCLPVKKCAYDQPSSDQSNHLFNSYRKLKFIKGCFDKF